MSKATPTPNPATDSRPDRSSKKVAHKKPLGFLPWLLLGLLALLLAAIILVINAIDDDGPDGPAGDTLGQLNSNGSGINGQDGDGQIAGTEDDQSTNSTAPSPAASTAPSADASSAPATSAPAPGGAAAGDGAGAALKVGEQDLLALAGGVLTRTGSRDVTGTAQVQSVVSDEGFWVGSSTTDRVFVYLTPEARQASGESGFRVTAGQSVQLTGTLTDVGTAPAAVAGVTDTEGRPQLQQQGSFVSASTVQLAG